MDVVRGAAAGTAVAHALSRVLRFDLAISLFVDVVRGAAAGTAVASLTLWWK